MNFIHKKDLNILAIMSCDLGEGKYFNVGHSEPPRSKVPRIHSIRSNVGTLLHARIIVGIAVVTYEDIVTLLTLAKDGTAEETSPKEVRVSLRRRVERVTERKRKKKEAKGEFVLVKG